MKKKLVWVLGSFIALDFQPELSLEFLIIHAKFPRLLSTQLIPLCGKMLFESVSCLLAT